MSRNIFVVLLVMCLAVSAFALTVPDDYVIPQRISSNEFFLESIRLNRLAVETYEFGDYDASTGFAEEAIRFAYLSDEFVAVQLLTEARRLLDWTEANSYASRYTNFYTEGRTFYETSVRAHADNNLEYSINSAKRSIEYLLMIQSSSGVAAPPSAYTTSAVPGALPRQYTVRTWANERDCLWNIAGYPWVYGDPLRWRDLYNANRARLPDPNNPDLIHPGMILEIPSIRGEIREGMWDPNRTYPSGG